MMQAFDGSGGAQQPVQPGVGQHMPREPMPGHMQAPSPAMNVGGHQHPMNGPYGHHGGGMPGQQPQYHHGGMSSQSPGRQGNYNPMQGGAPVGYSSHPPLHSPPSQHNPAPMHAPPMQRQAPGPMQHRVSMGGGHNGNGMGPGPGMHMPSHHDPMRSSAHSRGGMPPGQPPHFMAQQQPQHHHPPPPAQGQNVGQNTNIMAGSWQSDRDTPHRREMIQCIVKMLRKDKQGSPDSSGSSRLPQMAKQLEVSLYRDAPSFEAYRDMNTLKHRLQQIAVEVSRKTRNPGDPSASSSSSNPSRGHMNSRQSGYPPDPRHANPRSDSASPYGHMPPSNLNPSGHNPSMNRSMNGGAMPVAPPMQGSLSHGYDQRGAPGVPNHPPNGGGGSGRRSNNDPDMKTRIRHKQQRLLLLHHSAKCTVEDGRCSVTPHCADMKRLWRHMEACKDNQCTVAHCFSSRAILSHYRKCRDPNCPACGPVRETVRKNKATPGSRQSASTGPMMNNMRGDPMDHMSGSASGSYPPARRTPVNQPPPHQQSNNYPPVVRQEPPPPVPPPPPPQQQQAPMPPQQQQPPPQQPYGNADNQSFGQDDSTYRHRNGDSSRNAGSVPRPVENAPPPMHQPPPPQEQSRAEPREQDMQKIRHKQQRLLLLRHASRCQHVTDCPVTQHCASMKQLWEHIAQCKNPECTVQHCMSSRYVLSHYRRCRESTCPVCGPVRDMIRKQSRNDGPQSPGSSANRSAGRNSFDGPNMEDGSTQPMSMQSSSSSPPMERESKRQKSEMVAQPYSDPSSMQPVVSSSTALPESVPPAAKPERVASKQGGKSAQKGGGDYSLLSSFTIHQLETHLESLNRKTQLAPAAFKSKCLDLLKGLQTHQHGWVFNAPVDPVELSLPDYFDIIKKPMDLSTVQKKLETGVYRSIDEFEADVNMTFDNATTYNEPGSVVYDMAQTMKTKFRADYKLFLDELEKEEQQRRQNDKACKLCGCEKLLFEPPVYFCNGMNCQNQRIRRNSHFYVGGNNQYFWCNPCYNELDEKVPIELADMSIMKADLIKKKNDEVHEESWVHCDSCQSWVHQICGLFNTRQNKEQHSEYCCPKCLLQKRKTVQKNPSTKPLSAADLPRTTLSEWIEKSIVKKVERKKRQLAEEKAQSDNISIEDATRQLGVGGEVIVRQVTAMDRKLEVREMMRKRYAHKNYPEEFPFRCKCLVVFQHLDGVDVVLFALYVYEHGEDNPPPNKRVVYISYLDSVHFMRPRRIRTFVYHEILIAYLDYARKKGFSTAHIWACPPLKGDDYIFYAKPEDQKTPKDSRLRQWYHDMLIESQKRNICGKVTNMYDLYFANEKLDATAVPYLEGDYFPGEAENIIKMLEEGGGKKGGSKKKKNKGNKNKGGTGTRSTGVDEEALLASGFGPSLKDLDRDEVMVKLGETIQAMKESFIVAFLNWSGAKEEDMEVPQEIKDARIAYAAENDDGDMTGSKRDAVGMSSDTYTRSDGTEVKVVDDDAEDLDCEFLNNRQAFLNLCRGNHYQFDELRRSKHTSMMVLWHLHNRDAPKFVQQCFHCNREILSGKRYHCNVCTDYDLCQECYSDPKTNRGACNHNLTPIAVESGPTDEGGSRLTEAQRQDRQRKLMMHIQLIEHASKCNSNDCSSSNCARMKGYLTHASNCKTKVMGGCKICKRIWTLLRIHAQKCKERNCAIPQCNAIREKMRQLQKQQQAMDDRRRLEMNRHMRFGGGAGGGN